ncbi:Uncharacterized protein conserved in bacteria [Mycobacteroides abscessus]|uniref:Uncharacterized protein conserved in bacteria n=1 Tax=Mycobacteroides abscessus subsp. abscessus TaxID=1185650 RepID=A0AB38CYU2_9MYCO|nr:hypothetical protein [Mycobacteroides abscessus]MBE5418986.1 hypothetical protein [Mycobacteroides abscessus]MBE5456351.1 hypothetical protein [Mycobacteroides abscessus]OTR21861.1 hypothetical protein B9M80_15590 [Mycobacteroides abscessus]PVA34120.1 hypothetical protein DDJ98_14880 [Mycobacteroides abscessus]CPR64086.1 Uncharacterized protein conserved in bacteria [Mycobacteroides abscessus]
MGNRATNVSVFWGGTPHDAGTLPSTVASRQRPRFLSASCSKPLSSRVFRARIKVRTKEIGSFVKKLRKYEDCCWEKTTDKVGAQIALHTLDDVQRLYDILKAGIPGLEYAGETDKTTATHQPKVFGCAGLHVQMRFTDQSTRDGEQIECEIQLRTQSQDAWAYLEHGLRYKPVIAPSDAVSRKLERLSVLVEIFDEEVKSMIAEIERDPQYETALILRQAERWFFTFTTEPGESELSLEVLDLVKSSMSYGDPTEYAQTLAIFVDTHRRQIEDALNDYGNGSAYEGDFNYTRQDGRHCPLS